MRIGWQWRDSALQFSGVFVFLENPLSQFDGTFVAKGIRNNHKELFRGMYGIKPNKWKKTLEGMDRARFIVNSFTRMRFLYKNSGLNFNAKGEIVSHPKLVPWFKFPKRKILKQQIIFGHWSALRLYSDENVVCIDTGKVWGGKLTALKLSKSRLNSIYNSKHIVQS